MGRRRSTPTSSSPASPLRKGTGGEDGYSGFTMRDHETGDDASTGLDELLRAAGVEHVAVVGLALDYCVKATALDAVALGYRCVVPRRATAPVEVHAGDGAAAEADARRRRRRRRRRLSRTAVAKLLVVTWDGGGNVDPTIGIAQRLLDERVDRRRPSGRRPSSPASPAHRRRRSRPATRPASGTRCAMAADVVAALERERPDLVLVDFMMPGALCATEAAGVPRRRRSCTRCTGASGSTTTASPMGMAATVDDINALRADLGLAPDRAGSGSSSTAPTSCS